MLVCLGYDLTEIPQARQEMSEHNLKSMYFIKRKILRFVFRMLKKTPNDMPMVKYWRNTVSVKAKVTTAPDGSLRMIMAGEDEPFPGFPRHFSLFGELSKLKHEIKNQIFNDAWAMLQQGKREEAIEMIKGKVVGGLSEYLEPMRYDMVPPERMVTSVKEIWRVLSIMEKKEPRLRWFKETLTVILQEDDAYRFRFQWLISIFQPRWWNDPAELLSIALEELKHAEIVGDMKEKQNLLKTILMLILEDKYIHSLFIEFCSLVDWKKLKLTPADKYHFRGKWFKVDWDKFEY